MSLMGQFNVYGTDDPSIQCLCKVDIQPWVFSKIKGCKSLEAYCCNVVRLMCIGIFLQLDFVLDLNHWRFFFFL
jgi:hypothetical protein